ncbi:hypothetical protein F511_18635 [Dorcoceras hygrometricum]|uniref:Uncharacterized protein n=1 Tax=Dorcoceras hygrometricum TaxID=472368 RepID=A0A2Z7DFW8_9LAMI|nr:hypothetical protein F511_18635 [Dorcoceras hygrometricum]
MAATQLSFSSLPFSDKSSHQASLLRITRLSSFNCFLFLAFFIFITTLYLILKNVSYSKKLDNSIKIPSLPVNDDGIAAAQQKNEMGWAGGRENPGNSLLPGVMPLNPAKWDTNSGESRIFYDEPGGECASVQEEKKRKKKKRAKNKTPDSNEEVGKEKDGVLCLYPFTKSSSATQRKIKQQYDQLVKSHGSNGLTLDQIGQFINCLIEAKKELQHKSELIKRKFTITKALLFKADRSCFDRLRQQIYKLELEQKRLEEDTFVYNWLQEQLKVSPAYKKMLEIGARMEMEAKSACLVESTDTDISFEELLAQEKKDSFWSVLNLNSKSVGIVITHS